MFHFRDIEDFRYRDFRAKTKKSTKIWSTKNRKFWSTIWGTFVEPSRKISTTVGKYRFRAFQNIQKYQNRSSSAKVMGFQSWENVWYTFLISKFWKIIIFRFFVKFSENHFFPIFRFSKFHEKSEKSWFTKKWLKISKSISKIYPTLKSHNFGAIGPILIILDVPKSSGSVFSHSRTYFPGRFHESS